MLSIEEQLEILDDKQNAMEDQVYKSCRILIQHGLAEIYTVSNNDLPVIRATELGIEWNESFKQEYLQ